MSWFRSPGVLLPDLVALNGKWRGERAALIEADRSLSWREFERDTARVANRLSTLGLGSGDRIALLVDSSLEMVVLLFGILRCGCVAVPLNVSITDSSVVAMIEDADARALFASSRQSARLDALAALSTVVAGIARVGFADAGQDALDLASWLNSQPADWHLKLRPDQECNIIYSSGTTGVPKGIVHTHACRLHWAVDLGIALRYRSDCVTLCSLGLFSNITWVAMLCTVLVGGTIVVMPNFNAAAAIELIARKRVTHGAFVPLQLARLLAVPGLDKHDVSSLDTLMCCGSPLALEVKREFPRRFRCSLIELYGLTEGLCTILSPEDFAAKTESVGKPCPGTDLRIIGGDDCEVPQGETGEIVGLSAMLMSGYHGNDAASSEASWTDSLGQRWLRTGDLGKLDADGFLYIVDRKKDMILSGGQNIYPADIEAVMRTHPQVADVAVIGLRSRQWGETPVAVVVATANGNFAAQDLLEWTNARVGKQQRIRGVVARLELPRNANGKVLKRELRQDLADLVF
jgi:acyl-CoA synthetase (AMP-forming)/AMP-acid ligase II